MQQETTLPRGYMFHASPPSRLMFFLVDWVGIVKRGKHDRGERTGVTDIFPVFPVFPDFPISHLGGVVNNRTNKKESIQTGPWWLHNGGIAMQAFPEAPGALFSFRFPDLPPPPRW